MLSNRSTTAAADEAPVPRIVACFAAPSGTTSRTISRRWSGRTGLDAATGLLLARMRPGTDGIAGQVDALQDADDRRQADLVDVAAALGLLLAADHAVRDGHALDAGQDRPAERTPDADRDLVAAGVAGLVAQEQHVERAAGGLVLADGVHDRRGRGLGVPLLPAGDEVDRARDADRHRVAKLLERLGRAEGEDHGLAAVLLDEAHGLLDRALLVRADGEPEVPGVDRAAVLGEGDPAGDRRDALDADQDLHLRPGCGRFSGSNSGRAPTTATVTGYSSAKYCTNSLVPSTACSGGRYAIRTCLPVDGLAPAEVA